METNYLIPFSPSTNKVLKTPSANKWPKVIQFLISMYINANIVMWNWCIFVSIKVRHHSYCYAWLEKDADQITFLSSHPELENPNGCFIIWERISFCKTKIRVNSWQKWRRVSDIHEVSVWNQDTQLKMLKLNLYRESHIIWL